MDDIQHWSKSNNYWKWHSVRTPFWLIHFFDYLEFILGWALGELSDLAFEALRDHLFPRLIRWWRKSQQHQQYRDVAMRIHVAEKIHVAAEINAEVSHASISNPQ